MYYKKYTIIAMLILAVWALEGCDNDYTGPEINEKIVVTIDEADDITKVSLEEGEKKEFSLKARISGRSTFEEDTKIAFIVSHSAIEDYNEKNSQDYKELPEENYLLEKEEVIIPAGQKTSEAVKLTIMENNKLGNADYLLAIRLSVDSEGVSIGKGAGDRYFHVYRPEIGESINKISPIIITGFLPDPPGIDQPKPSHKVNNIELPEKTGYEYVQLMALEDIDFAEHNYSVVISKNRTVREEGWAAGGLYTYKFDLTEGSVEKGSFFYVGGKGKRINGYNSNDKNGLSTDISDANWIRTIQINEGVAPDDASEALQTGDGFGIETTSLLQNMNNKGSADGMAVFDGTDIDSKTVPLDAVFYNPPINGAYDPPNGLQIPNNDLYSREDRDGNKQPLFGEGTNDFTVFKPDASSLKGLFATMGGEVSEDGWITEREPDWKKLQNDSKLSDIEEGAQVTKFVRN